MGLSNETLEFVKNLRNTWVKKIDFLKNMIEVLDGILKESEEVE